MNQVWKWIIGGIGHLLAGLRDMAAGMVGKVLATFGLSVVTFNGLLPQLKSYVTQFMGGMPPEAMALLGYLNVGVAMSMILSALAVRMAWKIFIVPTAVANQLGG
jgi:hypothetical protein